MTSPKEGPLLDFLQSRVYFFSLTGAIVLAVNRVCEE